MNYTLITGASSGIGLELAKVFASKGKNLILVARSEKKLLDLAKELESQHSIQAKVITSDLSGASGAADLVNKIKGQGLVIENLVNNAGFGAFGNFANETKWQEERDMLQVNIVALTELCKAFIPEMLKHKKGRVLNVASTAAFQPGPLMAVYYASKAYVLHFSEALSEELEGTGVTVTTLCPGATESGFQSVGSLDNSKLFKDKKLPSSKEVASYAYDALMSGKRVAIHGTRNYLLAQTVRFTPRVLVAKIAKRIQERVS